MNRQESLDLFEQYRPFARKLVNTLVRRGRFPPDEYPALLNAGLWGLWQACERFDPARRVKFATYAERRIRGAYYDEMRRTGRMLRAGQVKHAWHQLRQGTVSLSLIDDRLSTPNVCSADELLAHLQHGLTTKSQRIVGLIAAGHTMKETGKACGCSESRISQLMSDVIVPCLRSRLEEQNEWASLD